MLQIADALCLPDARDGVRRVLVAVPLLLVACVPFTPVLPTLTPGAPLPACVVRDDRPDPRCTPGDTLPVTAAQVCTPGYAASVRAVSSRTRRAVFSAYGLTPSASYEVDHLISLELGGSNDARNLWPEIQPTAGIKDGVENRLHGAVCDGQMPLGEAQARIAADWRTALP